MLESTRVLLAESDSISAQLLSFTLEREGFEVILAHGGGEALRVARQQRTDLVISEVLLDDMSGLELCHQLRAGWNTQNIPIVLITTLGNTAERIAGLQAGADEYLTKPYDVREMMIRVRRLVSTYSNCSQLNHLTKLPGIHLIEQFVNETCRGDTSWALLQIDINHFTVYNRMYGFEAGNSVLRRTADVLREVVLDATPQPAFLGHEGRDDFVAVVARQLMREKCELMIERFHAEVSEFYPDEQKLDHYHAITDRQGKKILAPRLALSIGVLTGDLCENMSYLEMREAAHAVLSQAKVSETSSVFVNRRHMAGRKPGLNEPDLKQRSA